ncbi:MAG: hypothetical protein ACPL1D_01925, partial [Microgenomates group bacterium]
MNNDKQKINDQIKKFLSLFIVIIIYSLFIIHFHPVFAQEPQNNIFGIHLAQPHLEGLKKVKELVNSSGGDWGYVTLVIQENDRNLQKWQEIFDLLRQYHLIPIIRLATKFEGENWRRPTLSDISSWVEFLDSLNWVVKNRYIVLFNEPNHASEWGGVVDPQDYGKVAFAFASALKKKNQDFFVMLAGFDASSPHQPPKYWDEEKYLKNLFNINLLETELAFPQALRESVAPRSSSESEVSLRRSLAQTSSFCANFIECFNNGLISGWVSHSYPNPDFSGSPYDWGRGTIHTYLWELELLKNLGVNKNLPVFITETGWKRKNIGYPILDIEQDWVAQNFKVAFENFWLKDDRVVAVTPFIFDYQGEPFFGFS